jgi:hypothetical protein
MSNAALDETTLPVDLSQFAQDLDQALRRAGVAAGSRAHGVLFKMICDDVLWYYDQLELDDLKS